jgi:hypothetical protein
MYIRPTYMTVRHCKPGLLNNVAGGVTGTYRAYVPASWAPMTTSKTRLHHYPWDHPLGKSGGVHRGGSDVRTLVGQDDILDTIVSVIDRWSSCIARNMHAIKHDRAIGRDEHNFVTYA